MMRKPAATYSLMSGYITTPACDLSSRLTPSSDAPFPSHPVRHPTPLPISISVFLRPKAAECVRVSVRVVPATPTPHPASPQHFPALPPRTWRVAAASVTCSIRTVRSSCAAECEHGCAARIRTYAEVARASVRLLACTRARARQLHRSLWGVRSTDSLRHMGRREEGEESSFVLRKDDDTRQ
ncbi:hypothetical protein C8Q80DRAFT_450776 [Daedaleopsis nitida]|nr:hypothetical protein C8Q80DRAFT_450776 [Daedaleopsis nitida]